MKGKESAGKTVVRKQVEAYFAACDATAERVPKKDGTFWIRQIPYTLQGLAAALGLREEELLAIAGNAEDARARAISDALTRISAYLWERALIGELEKTIAQEALRTMTGIRAETGMVRIVLEDPEEWGK